MPKELLGDQVQMVVHEEEVSFIRRSEIYRETGCIVFTNKSNQQRNQMWSSVFGNANVSNLAGTLLEGNKDHLLNQARSDLAKRSLHVESLNGSRQGITRSTTRICWILSRTSSIKIGIFLRKEKALRDPQIRRKHEMGNMSRERKYNKLI